MGPGSGSKCSGCSGPTNFLTLPCPHSGMEMPNANRYPARHSLPSNKFRRKRSSVVAPRYKKRSGRGGRGGAEGSELKEKMHRRIMLSPKIMILQG